MLPIVLLLGLGLVIALVIAFARRGGPARLATRSSVDGFYISTSGLRPGTLIRYRCLVRTRPHNGQVMVEPGPDELFVYTGNTPTDIELNVLDAGTSTTYDDDDDGVISTGAASLLAGGSTDYVDTSTTTSSDDSASGSSGASAESAASDAGDGFPPAY